MKKYIVLFLISGFIMGGEPAKKYDNNKSLYETIVNADGTKSYKCKVPDCQYTASKLANINTHIQRHKKPDVPRNRSGRDRTAERERAQELIQCPKCPDQVTRGNLSKHLKAEGWFKCGHCKKDMVIFPTEQAKEAHIAQMHKQRDISNIFDEDLSPEERRREFETLNGYKSWNEMDKNFMTKDDQAILHKDVKWIMTNYNITTLDRMVKQLREYWKTFYAEEYIDYLIDLYEKGKRSGNDPLVRDSNDTYVVDEVLRIPVTQEQKKIIDQAIKNVKEQRGNAIAFKQEMRDLVAAEIQNIFIEKNGLENDFLEDDSLQDNPIIGEYKTLDALWKKIPLYDENRDYAIKLAAIKVEDDDNRSVPIDIQVSDYEIIKTIIKELKKKHNNERDINKKYLKFYKDRQELNNAFKEESKKYFLKRAKPNMARALGKNTPLEYLDDLTEEEKIVVAPIAQKYVKLQEELVKLFEKLPLYDRQNSYKFKNKRLRLLREDGGVVAPMEIEDEGEEVEGEEEIEEIIEDAMNENIKRDLITALKQGKWLAEDAEPGLFALKDLLAQLRSFYPGQQDELNKIINPILERYNYNKNSEEESGHDEHRSKRQRIGNADQPSAARAATPKERIKRLLTRIALDTSRQDLQLRDQIYAIMNDELGWNEEEQSHNIQNFIIELDDELNQRENFNTELFEFITSPQEVLTEDELFDEEM